MDRIRASTESGPVRKWVKVIRPPAPHIKFGVEKWVPTSDLTDEERIKYNIALDEDEEVPAADNFDPLKYAGEGAASI
jgi:hypothetical protein